jgi:hypothetical protein
LANLSCHLAYHLEISGCATPALSQLSTGQKIDPRLKPLILCSAGGARATQNQGFSGFCPVLSSLRYQGLRTTSQSFEGKFAPKIAVDERPTLKYLESLRKYIGSQ